jgi:hypothetical protein
MSNTESGRGVGVAKVYGLEGPGLIPGGARFFSSL